MTEDINRHCVRNLLFVLASAFTLIICCASNTKTNASAPANLISNGRAVRQLPPQEKTVDQTRKNIQVLKGLRESQIFPVMWFIRDSLGVHCDHCHVHEGTDWDKGWVWERDDKPEKIRAREMMKMVLEINKVNFGSNQAVTCYSCHRGRTRPETVVPLPTEFIKPRTNETTVALPSAEEILSKYIKAVGGQDASAKLKTIVYTGSIERPYTAPSPPVVSSILSPVSRKDAAEITIKQPDKFLLKLTTPQGIINQGLDGTVAWFRDRNGVRQLAAADLELSKQRLVLYGVIKVAEQSADMKVAGMEKVGDRDAYVVALTISPQTIRKYFFDVQTGLLLRRVTTTTTLLVPLPEQVDFDDYRDVGGVKLPFTLRTADVDMYSPATRRFTDVRVNVVVDDSVFKMPASQK